MLLPPVITGGFVVPGCLEQGRMEVVEEAKMEPVAGLVFATEVSVESCRLCLHGSLWFVTWAVALDFATTRSTALTFLQPATAFFI